MYIVPYLLFIGGEEQTFNIIFWDVVISDVVLSQQFDACLSNN